MKFRKVIFISILATIVVLSACASKKHRYNQCPTFGKKALSTEKVHGRI